MVGIYSSAESQRIRAADESRALDPSSAVAAMSAVAGADLLAVGANQRWRRRHRILFISQFQTSSPEIERVLLKIGPDDP